ncbi:MAG TPA: 4-alpha-glucanotransferase, partial [Longimicrobiales bacterium]|nr:4-alpha-glucanotransferase [Longimicrobiales bacterium]
LRRLAGLYGIQQHYTGFSGAQRQATPEAILAVLRCLGAPVQDLSDVAAASAERVNDEWQRPLDPVLIAWDGRLPPFRLRLPSAAARGRIDFELYTEDGTVRAGALRARPANQRSPAGTVALQAIMPIRLSDGYHELAVDAGTVRAHALIIAAPRRAYRTAAKKWGVFLPLYALCGRGLHGVGDFGALAELASWAAAAGADLVSTLPLLANYLAEPFEPSPYAPVSRLFWNELFVDLASAVRTIPCPPAEAAFQEESFALAADALNTGELVDYQAVAKLKRSVLQPLAHCFFEAGGQRSGDFDAFLRDYPAAEDYAGFRACADRRKTGWQDWPADQRDGRIHERDYDRADYRYHLFAQYLASRQLHEYSRENRAQLYLDFPLGVHASGYDVWRERDLFATGVCAGAPPDAFFTQGQNWGFPPMIPDALRADGYSYLRAALRTHLRYAGALRLDHVMALYRLYWVPEGFPADQGVYVRYPAEELYALLALESTRHATTIIGEDLGTVPHEVRAAMRRHGFLRMYVVQFEARPHSRNPLPAPPADAVVSLNTHDMPPFTAYHAALDAELRFELGLLPTAEVDRARAARVRLIGRIEAQLERAGFLHQPADAQQLRDALLAFLARSDAELLLVNLEDLWNEERPQNVPGTGPERPNWRRRARYSLEQIVNSPEINAALSRLNHLRRES